MEYRPHYRSVLGLKAKNGPGELTVTDAYLHIEFARYERGLVRVHKRIEQLVVDNTKFSFLKIDGPNVADSCRLPPNDEIKWTMPLRQAPDNCSAELIFSVKTASWEVQHSDPYQISGSYNHPRWLPALDEKLPPQEVKTRWHLLRFSKEFRDWVDTW